MTGSGRFQGVVLVGFMGSGKSSVGKALARKIGAQFVDVDERIEAAAGRKIRDLFAEEGEAAFREREKAALREVLSERGRIVATGGGAFLDEGNRALLKRYAPVVYLEASPEAVLERLSGDVDRPLLRGGAHERIVRDLLTRRVPGYRQADFTVNTDGRTVDEVAGNVLALFEGRGGRES